MPQVIHSFRGDNREPRLKLPKGERAILENAAGLCKAIQNATVGHNVEMADKARQLSDDLSKFAAIEEHELGKPF